MAIVVHPIRSRRCSMLKTAKEKRYHRPLPRAIEKKWFLPVCMYVCAQLYCKLLLSLYSFTIWFQNIIYSEKNKQCGCCFGSFCIFFVAAGTYINSRSSRDKNSCRTVTALRCSAIFFLSNFGRPPYKDTKNERSFFVLVRPKTKICLRTV